jgi:hypothetical protein
VRWSGPWGNVGRVSRGNADISWPLNANVRRHLMSRVQVLSRIPRSRLPKALPKIYQPACDASRLRESEYTVLIFPAKKVSLSGVVSRALSKVPASSHIIAFAHNLTAEGLAILAERKAVVFLLHGVFHWTDETYRSVA